MSFQLPGKGEEKMDTSESLEVHPRKRKLKKETASSASSSSSTSGDINNDNGQQGGSGGNSQEPHPPPMLNCFEMYLNIRKQVLYCTAVTKRIVLASFCIFVFYLI